jgi:hypothetical protein
MKAKARTKREPDKLGSHEDGDCPIIEGVGEPPPNKMNPSERRYAKHLDELLASDAILWWAREPVSIRLARGSSYVPDFLVMRPDGAIEIHEVKSSRGSADFHNAKWHHAHRDSYSKWKIAANRFPVRFFMVWPENGSWCYRKAVT